MAVANPCLQKEWNEWWIKIGGHKRIPWRERMMRWIKVEVREGEEAGVDRDVESNEEEASEAEEEEVDTRAETKEGEDEGEGGESAEEKGGEEEEEVRKEEDENEGFEVKDGEEEVDEDEETKEEETIKKGEEGERVVENRGEEKAANEEEEEGKKEEEEEEGKVDEEEKGQEVETEVFTKEEEEEEEEPGANEEDEEEVDQPNDQTEGCDGENIRHEGEEDDEDDEESVSESAESNEEDSEPTGSEDEDPDQERFEDDEVYDEDPEVTDEKSSWGESISTFGDLTTSEKDEYEKKTTTHEERTVSESWTTEEEVQDIDLEEEESSDDEEATPSIEDGEDDEVKFYSKNDYTSEVFQSLKQLRDSSQFTDLTLTTTDGKTFEVHSLVLAAVSSLVRKNLSRTRTQRRDHLGSQPITLGWSLSPGLEVDRVGLEAIVEFAYTGFISSLNRDNVNQIQAAAETLGVPRVTRLCAKVDEPPAKTQEVKKEEEEMMCAAQQLSISLQLIRQMWTDRVGCDVALEALGESLYAHRVILAASSDYFRSMFTLGMKESHQHSVTLPFLLASELEVLIGCSYSGTLPLSWSCVFEVTGTALQLQYQPALALCLDFLHQELNPESCLDVVSFAEAYELPQVLEAANDFILRQFQRVVSTPKFKDLPARQLLRYLNSRSLCVPSELVVFKAVVSWIQAKPRTRLRLIRVLMKTIHFPLMTFKDFKEVRSDNMWSDHQMEALYEAIFEDFCTDETTFQNRCRVYVPKESLVLVGGEQTSDDLGRRIVSKELWFGNSLRSLTGIRKSMEWRRLGEMPEPARFCHEVAVLKGQLYVFGGKKYYGNGDILNSVHRFDPLHNFWESLADMLGKRSSFSVVVLDGKILAIGGHSDSDFTDSVERYCPSTNSWSFTWPLDLPLSGHVAKVFQGQIFVSGGRNNDYPCVASMFLYHPGTGSSCLANMAKPRAHHCMEVLGECLYVAGGISSDDDANVVDQLSCEVYSPAANVWTAFAPFPVPHVGAGSAVLEGKFYVLGGYSQEDYSDTNMVHRYDVATQRWENMGKMPGPNNDIRACVLGLPEHFRS